MLIMLMSCSSNDEVNSGSNTGSYEIVINDELNEYDVSILTVLYESNNKLYVELMSDLYWEGGEGFYSGITLYLPHEDDLENGEYVFSYSNSREDGTFYKGVYYVENNSFTDDNFEEIDGEIVDGTVTLVKNNDEYTIDINGVNELGGSVVGFYKGELTFY